MVAVNVRMTGGTYSAQAGKGRKSVRATCTMGPDHAARACAAKWFGVPAGRTLSMQTEAVKEGVILVLLPDAEQTQGGPQRAQMNADGQGGAK